METIVRYFILNEGSKNYYQVDRQEFEQAKVIIEFEYYDFATDPEITLTKVIGA